MNLEDLIPIAVRSCFSSPFLYINRTMFFQMNKGNIRHFSLERLEDAAHRQFFKLGRKIGRKPENADLELVRVCLVGGWFESEDELPPGIRLPEEGWGMIFLMMDAQPSFTAQVTLYETGMEFLQFRKRGKPSDLVYVGESNAVEDLQENTWAQAFVAGWRSRTLSDERMHKMQAQHRWQAFLRL